MSLGSNSGTYISSLINAGSDAMHNLYYVKFTGAVVDKIASALTVRLQDFTPPAFSQNNNEVHFMTTSVSFPSAEITGDKNLDLTFRLDCNYQVYEFLLKQQSSTMNGNIGWAINQVPNNVDADGGLTVHVYAFDRTKGNNPDDEENYSELYNFKYCWIKSLDGLSYTYDSTSPLTIKASIGFMDFEDPMNLLLEK